MSTPKQKFVVVKHAKHLWQSKWEEDPKITGVHISHSAAHTFTGNEAGCEESYTDVVAAEAMAVKLNSVNPCGDYAVCPLFTENEEQS